MTENHIRMYTKYIHEQLKNIDINTATYKNHLHKVFELLWCIRLTEEKQSIFLRWEDVSPELREEKHMKRDMGVDAWDTVGNRIVQMKCYNDTICWRSFSTFLACWCSFFINTKPILCRTSQSTLVPLVKESIISNGIIEKFITDQDFRTECKRIQRLTIEELEIKLKELVEIIN